MTNRNSHQKKYTKPTLKKMGKIGFITKNDPGNGLDGGAVLNNLDGGPPPPS